MTLVSQPPKAAPSPQKGTSCPHRLPLRKPEAAAAGLLSASSPRPSSWSSWTPPSSESRCPRCGHDLGFTPQGLSWVFNAYVVAFGGLLLLGGRLSDLFGARRIFSIGWVVLAAGSLMAGFAGNVPVELAGRAVQGAGSALIAPAALTLLFMTFGSSPKELTKALALYGAAAPAGGTAGVFLGGVLTEYASWPWVFFINVPLAVVVLAVTRSVLPAGGDPPRLPGPDQRRHRHRRARSGRVRRRPRPAGGLDLGLDSGRRPRWPGAAGAVRGHAGAVA